MHIAYLTSRYPTLSETFIAREMQELVNLGHKITITQLRWAQPWKRTLGLRVSPAQVINSQFNPFLWHYGLTWAIRTRPAELKAIWHEILLTLPECDVLERLKLIALFPTTLRIAQCLENTDITHIRNRFLDGGAISAMWLSRLLNVPYSITISTKTMPYARSITQKTVSNASFCIGDTQETFELIKELRGSDQNVHLIRAGLNLSEFNMMVGTNEKVYRPLILAVGRLVKKKGFDLLIRACGRLKEWGVDYDCKIIGSGPEYSYLRKIIDDFGLERHVALVGALPFDEVKHYFRKAWVHAMPSRLTPNDQDGLPNVITESLALKVPVVATAVAAIPELIIDEETGLLVPPDNVEQLALAIRRMLEDEHLRTLLANAGYERVQREFNIIETGKRLDQLIREHTPITGRRH